MEQDLSKLLSEVTHFLNNVLPRCEPLLGTPTARANSVPRLHYHLTEAQRLLEDIKVEDLTA